MFPESYRPISENKITPETLNSSNFQVFFTDHAADNVVRPGKYSEGTNFSTLFTTMKENGFDARRTDWRWKDVQPLRTGTNEEYLEQYEI